MALAFLLCRNDVQLTDLGGGGEGEGGISSGQQKFPKMDELKSGIGIIGPVAGDDLIVRLTPKVVCILSRIHRRDSRLIWNLRSLLLRNMIILSLVGVCRNLAENSLISSVRGIKLVFQSFTLAKVFYCSL